MTRDEFIAKAIRQAERAIRAPSGWWGTWLDITNGTRRVRFGRGVWVLSIAGRVISHHDSRSSAIAKARRIGL